jgi:hypothetical protein
MNLAPQSSIPDAEVGLGARAGHDRPARPDGQVLQLGTMAPELLAECTSRRVTAARLVMPAGRVTTADEARGASPACHPSDAAAGAVSIAARPADTRRVVTCMASDLLEHQLELDRGQRGAGLARERHRSHQGPRGDEWILREVLVGVALEDLVGGE